MKIDIDKIENIIRQAASEIVLPKFKCLQENEIEIKSGESDFVTVADKMTEVFITTELQKLYPDCLVIGEESVFANPNIIKDLSSEKPIFVIDPIDGTGNYARCDDKFGIMLAYAESGEIKKGWVYLPVFDKMIIGSVGEGVYINKIRHKITEKTKNTNEMIGAGIDALPNIKGLFWDRCSATTYCDFVEDKFSFIAHISRKMYPWDHMPGLLFVKEAGGEIGSISGVGYDYRKDYDSIIVADSYDNFLQIQSLANVFLKESS